jgi:5-methylcytosine-specific restriction endonuclease McrBC regulatory subunit McrC
LVAVLDTKWKVPPNGLPSDSDLQQMFLYNELLGSQRAILLYPKVASSTSISGSYATRPARTPHACEQRHIGLLRESTWNNEEIKAQLSALLSELAAA